MKAIQVKCPNCNAHLRTDETTQTVTCEYCGTASQIQRRTRILERVQMPAQFNPAMRYAVQSHSSAWKWLVLGIVFVPVIITVIVIVTVVNRVRQTVDIPKEVKAAFSSNGIKIDMSGGKTPKIRGSTWQGTDSVLVADVDGDGTPELIGRGRQVQAGDSIRLLALELATGTLKWQSEPLGTYSDTYTGPLSLAGDLVVHANNSGTIQAFALKDGARKWKATQDERVAGFCLGDGDTLVAVGADDKLRTYARADGAVVGTPKAAPGKGRSPWDKKAPCALLPNDDQTPFHRVEDSRHTRYNQYRIDGNKHGLNVDHAIEGPDGGRVLGGTRKEGTNVTMIVAVDAKNAERWRSAAAAEALTATGGPRHIVVGERETCIIYYSNTYRTACFAMADGKRLWDMESPSFAEGLQIVARFLVMTTARNIEVHDVETGVEKWTSESWD